MANSVQLGPVHREILGQLTITWGGAFVSDETRATLRAKWRAIKPRRRRWVSHARSRALAEQRGAAALARPDVSESMHAPTRYGSTTSRWEMNCCVSR